MNLLKKSNKIFECNFQKELKHFEHRIMKHDMLQSEVQRSAQKMKVGDVEDEHKHNDLKNKVDNYGRKVGSSVVITKTCPCNAQCRKF